MESPIKTEDGSEPRIWAMMSTRDLLYCMRKAKRRIQTGHVIALVGCTINIWALMGPHDWTLPALNAAVWLHLAIAIAIIIADLIHASMMRWLAEGPKSELHSRGITA